MARHRVVRIESERPPGEKIGAALVVAGKAANLKDGVTQAQQSIDSGAAKQRLDKLIAVSNA